MKHLLVFLFLPVLIFAQDHLLITEVFIPPAEEASAAFVEIFNPTDAAVSLNQVYLANYNTYYNMVKEIYPSNAAQFVVQFPNIELAVDDAIAVALDGTNFFEYFGKRADYEVIGSDDNTPDMADLKVGDNPSFSFTSGMIVLFHWDGSTDLIQDVDYIPWGYFNSSWMDKSGESIDGPDADSDSSTYNNDLAKSSQQAQTVPTGGRSLQRSGLIEVDEVSNGGNGIGGHNEATENWQSSFIAADPGPGNFSENPGDGTGTALISPTVIKASKNTEVEIEINGVLDFTLESVEITIPNEWIWSQTESSILIDGSGFESASVSVEDSVITITNAAITSIAAGQITILNTTSPADSGNFTFKIRTSISGGKLTEISVFPNITVLEFMTIQEARQMPPESIIKVSGVVIIGIGILRDDRTDVYIQDESGYAINIYRSGSPDERLQRGNEIYVEGTLTLYNGLLEITDYTLTVAATNAALPTPLDITTDEAASTIYDSRFVAIKGQITETYYAGGGTNLYVNDGSGECTVRIWDTADLDLDEYSAGDYVRVQGIESIYNNAGQILLAYQEDISKLTVDTSGVYLKVPNKPFVPDKGEELEIEYGVDSENSHITLRIFDLGGRLIVTLFDGTVSFIQKPWNGRDHLDELVPVGTYICHLEVVNEDTGKRIEKVAPIVVGTVLK